MMLGFTTKAEARQIGVSHHGSYYGIPMWLGDVDSYCPLAFAKWAPLELVVSLFSVIEGIVNSMLDQEPTFKFKVGRRIDQ
ncbi:TPA: hypothetical protein NHZ94_004511 [Pseudomonas aeruginosa]|nr:hypothetical protein [Pseudomonas aeruginosa]OFM79649.1 hypothetical protein HMPREF2666_01240 [Pseudomonas sp. HMSC058C05]OFR55325.1 hypothetical protein HMPREF2886_03220 [Pseudomonas sp. HMSC066A08]ALZ16666.1 hypothetical protein HV98_29680 [Pseudomonas aeruginosa]EIU3127875.1 hypothetical protein [Pseudomonas aeruginosa]EIU5421809.1 hypothetical protein [Pseudomonas aeruginosa]